MLIMLIAKAYRYTCILCYLFPGNIKDGASAGGKTSFNKTFQDGMILFF